MTGGKLKTNIEKIYIRYLSRVFDNLRNKININTKKKKKELSGQKALYFGAYDRVMVLR